MPTLALMYLTLHFYYSVFQQPLILSEKKKLFNTAYLNRKGKIEAIDQDMNNHINTVK